MPFVPEPVDEEDLLTAGGCSGFSGQTGVEFILFSAYRNLTITNTSIITANIRADFDFRALESDDARFLNQPDFPDLGVLGDSDGSDDLAASKGDVINGSGMSLHFFLDFFNFDFATSPPLEKVTFLSSAESGFLVLAV